MEAKKIEKWINWRLLYKMTRVHNMALKLEYLRENEITPGIVAAAISHSLTKKKMGMDGRLVNRETPRRNR